MTAVVETLGFTRRQVLIAVAWQATTVGAVVVMLVGLPVGVGVALVLLMPTWSRSCLAGSLPGCAP